jgi:hypothetical protein
MNRTLEMFPRQALRLFLVLVSFAIGRNIAAQATITPGAACQARYGIQEKFLLHGVVGTANNQGGSDSPSVDVSCSLVRTVISTSGPVVVVYAFRSSSSTLPLSCTLDIRRPNGQPSATQTQSFSGVGEFTFRFSQGKVNPDDYYLVMCSVPYASAIRSTYHNF